MTQLLVLRRRRPRRPARCLSHDGAPRVKVNRRVHDLNLLCYGQGYTVWGGGLVPRDDQHGDRPGPLPPTGCHWPCDADPSAVEAWQPEIKQQDKQLGKVAQDHECLWPSGGCPSGPMPRVLKQLAGRCGWLGRHS